jgi:hypothetical protein
MWFLRIGWCSCRYMYHTCIYMLSLLLFAGWRDRHKTSLALHAPVHHKQQIIIALLLCCSVQLQEFHASNLHATRDTDMMRFWSHSLFSDRSYAASGCSWACLALGVIVGQSSPEAKASSRRGRQHAYSRTDERGRPTEWSEKEKERDEQGKGTHRPAGDEVRPWSSVMAMPRPAMRIPWAAHRRAISTTRSSTDPCMHPIHTHPRPGCSNCTYANGQWQSSDDRSCRLQSVYIRRQCSCATTDNHSPLLR